MDGRPEFIVVPGAWHGPESFEPTTGLLEKAGFTVHGVSLPCVGADPPLPSFEPDVRAITDVLERVLSSGKDVVLVMHSGDAVNPVNPRDIFYNDLSDDAAAPHVWALRQHSYLAFASTLTAAPWKTVPSTYVLCEADHAIPLPVQEGMIAAAKEAAPSAFDVVERCGAGHSPFLSRPDWLADRLAESAR
ncbi:hypothetical protein QTJ16_002071 [Diplocarpon rosae]|uniref:AB hydrolase-1 domain-containing protein n=1 Tax=Diplocarpon rosae TaxID=946125 RepID=A0AAD9WG73_9HELO|nr:hypothetical protein QTJ16_002071 [Diplocarpon rosae]